MEKNYREIEFLCGWDIKRAVIELLEYKEKGELVCGEFNGHMLYSDTVTMDSAYLAITGKSKADFEKEHQVVLKKKLHLNIQNQTIGLLAVDTLKIMYVTNYILILLEK